MAGGWGFDMNIHALVVQQYRGGPDPAALRHSLEARVELCTVHFKYNSYTTQQYSTIQWYAIVQQYNSTKVQELRVQ